MSRARLRLLVLVTLLLHALPSVAAEVWIGPEVPITWPTVENLPGKESVGETAPLWTGQEWLFAWGEAGTRQGVYLHRLAWDGSSIEDTNVSVLPGIPHGLVASGAGYLLAGGGIHRLDHSGALVDRVLDHESRALAADGSVLAWHPALTSATLIEDSVTTSVDVGRLTGGLSPWQEPAVTTDGTTYFVTWIHHSSDGEVKSSILYNLIGPGGEVLLDSPGFIVSDAKRAASVVAGWDGSQYLIAWARQTPEGPWDFSISALDAASGVASEPGIVSTRAGWNWSGPQMIQVEPGLVLLSWTELVLGSGSTWVTRGRFFEQGLPAGEPFLISEEPMTLGFDGRGRFAGISRQTTVRFFTRSGFSLEPATVARSLRYGVPERLGLAINDFDPFVMWMSGGPYSWYLKTGWHPRSTDTLVPTLESRETGESPSHAASDGSRLIAWAGTTSTSREIRTMVTDLDGTPLSEPVAVEEGSSPTVAAHAGGWLLTWNRGGLLRFAFVESDGRLRGLPETLADPEPQPHPVADRQVGIVFVPIDDDETMVLWQEGEFRTLCRLSACPVPPAPASIRSIVVKDGQPDRSTLRSYDELEVAGRPAAVRVGDQVLLMVVRQMELERGSIEGIMLTLDGSPIGDPFSIVDQIGPFDAQTPDLALLGSTVLAMWARVVENGDFVGKLEGAVIEGLPDGTPVVTPVGPGESFGARSLLLVRESDSRAALYYMRQAETELWEGTRQIFVRTILLDPSMRRRATLRR